MSTQQTLSEQFTMRLTARDYQRLKKQATVRERDVAELARIVVRQWLDTVDDNHKGEKNG